MGDDLDIREARPEDAVGIASVLRRAFAEFEPLYNAASFAETVITAARVVERQREGPIWIAVRHGRILGTVSVRQREEALLIRGMAVVPEAQGQGVGRMLLGQAEQFARESGCRRVLLWTTPFLASAIALYERCGFQRTDEEPHELCGTPLFAMAKEL